VGLFAPLRHFIEALVHPSVRQDALTAARHRAFIAPRVLGSIVALVAFPIYLAVRGTPSATELLIFAWLVAPILTAYFLSRTGQYESAHVLSSVALTGLVTAVAAATGGILSFAAIWLVVVPLEAGLSASRRVVATASICALAAGGLLVVSSTAGLLPTPGPSAHAALAALGIVSASLYATGLALGAEALARTNFWLLYSEEDRYRLLACDITDVITRHGRDGALLFVSPGAASLFGCSVAELHGQGLFDRVHVADRPAYRTALGDAAIARESRSIEFRARRDDIDEHGQPAAAFVWVEMRCRPLDYGAASDASRQEVVAVLRDVTERKNRQQALLDARAEAERANAAKTRFLATMSHELRTPLNAIIGFSEMLMQETVLMLDTERRNEYAALINGSGRHLLSVVNGILDMSRIETDNFEITPEPFAPAQVVEACCDLLALRAREAGIHLEKSVTGDLPDIIADKRALHQILLNLLSNAIRFSERGGEVKIGVRPDAADVVFTIEDNGVGIGGEDLARLGEPYFQAHASYDRRHSGTGLGLSIVKGLVRLHGGEIDIASQVEQGTRVTVRLPVDCEGARPASKSSGSGWAEVVDRLPGANQSRSSGGAPIVRPAAVGEEIRPSDIRVKRSA
jgi:two-component system, cell cycle sensor histidine kinase DivJ